MGFEGFIDRVEDRTKEVTVLNRTEPDPVYSLLEKTIGDDAVAVRQDETAGGTPVDAVVVEEEGEAIAVSSLEDVRDTLLLVNSDLYVTGTVDVDEVETPDAIERLDGVTFDVADRSKLLLIHISRHVERLALENGNGVLHSGFQRLSRLHAEDGTYRCYQKIAGTDIETHVYGIPDHDPGRLPDCLRVHGYETGEIPESWFVVYDGDGRDNRRAALVAVETGPNEYRGYWTFDARRVDRVLEYIGREYLNPSPTSTL